MHLVHVVSRAGAVMQIFVRWRFLRSLACKLKL